MDVLQTTLKERLRALRWEGVLTEWEVEYSVLANPTIPSFSCLPKTHKPGNKIIPVVSNVNAPTSRVCSWLVKRFRSFEEPFSYSIKNSREIAERLNGMAMEEDESLVSFDVESLYPSVLVEEAFVLYKEWIETQDISDLEARKYTN